MCEKFYDKYIGGRLWCDTPTWRDKLQQVLQMCESEDVDPALYLESQFCTMRLWSKANGGKFYPNVLMGANAVKRYESFKERNKRHTKNIASRSDDIDLTADMLAAETMYAEMVLKNILWKLGTKSRHIVKMVKARYPKWKANNPEFAAIRRRVLMEILDKNIPSASTKVFIKRDFQWKMIAAFLKQSGYNTNPDPTPTERDLKGVLYRIPRE